MGLYKKTIQPDPARLHRIAVSKERLFLIGYCYLLLFLMKK